MNNLTNYIFNVNNNDNSIKKRPLLLLDIYLDVLCKLFIIVLLIAEYNPKFVTFVTLSD